MTDIRYFQLRDAAIERASGCCEWTVERRLFVRTNPLKDRTKTIRCTQRNGLQLHHLHYRSVGQESLGDVRILCDWHHRLQTVMDWSCLHCGDPVFCAEDGEAEGWLRDQSAMNPEMRVIDMLRGHGQLCNACDHMMDHMMME